MNTEITIHPKLHHLGLTTGNLEAMIDWYRKVLGMTVVHQTEAAAGGQKDAPTLKAAWVSNDEANHRLAFVQLPGLTADPDRSRHHRLSTSPSSIGPSMNCLAPMPGSRALASSRRCPPTADRRRPSIMRTRIATALRSMSTTTATAGRRASTCERHRISPETRWAPMSIRTR
jgi:hypothetical protein